MERDINDLDSNIDISRFRIRLVKAIVKLLNEAESEMLGNTNSSDHNFNNISTTN